MTEHTEASIPALKERVQARLTELLPELVALSDDIFAHPEVRFQEHHAVAAIKDELSKHDIRVQHPAAGLDTAFIADWPQRKAGPRVGILAEYDALPGLGHACGHNLIGTSAVGAFLALQAVADELGGSATLYGCPAEEGGGGKLFLLEADAFDGLDAAIMTHPFPEARGINVDRHFSASGGLTLRFHGKPAHSAGAPQDGINAVDAMVMTYVGVNGLRQRLTRDTNISCMITHGGSATNVIPDFAEIVYLVRGERWQNVEATTRRIITVAEGCAAAIGATVESLIAKAEPSPEFKYYSEDMQNQTLNQVFINNIEALGLEHTSYSHLPGGGSTDFANVMHHVPGVHLNLALPGATESPHTVQFAEASGGPAGPGFIERAATIMAFSAIDVLMAPGVLEEMRTEHSRNQQAAG